MGSLTRAPARESRLRVGAQVIVWVVAALLTSGCAHRAVFVTNGELERGAMDLSRNGTTRVAATDGTPLRLRADEPVATLSGEIRAGKWIAANCEPSGLCHFAGDGVTVQRVDFGASVRRGLEIASAGLFLGAATAGTACGVGAICNGDQARVAGALTLGGTAALLSVGFLMLALCTSCWVVR